MSQVFVGHQVGLLFFLLLLLIIGLTNLKALRRLGDAVPPPSWPAVSIMVPARNEERNIGACVTSLVNQDYPNYEVLVLDDESTDGTSQVLNSIHGSLTAGGDGSCREQKLVVLQGRNKPEGWLGKNWACHQLAQVARGEILVFTDADTVHHPSTLRDAVAMLKAENADFISAFPRQIVKTWSEKLIIPFLPWAVWSFFPLMLAHRFRLPRLTAAIGQFMMIRRPAYDAIGGHDAIRTHVVDDFALARRINAQGRRWRLVDGTTRVTCRMYQSYDEVRRGFGKNLYALFGQNLLAFLFVWMWLVIAFWEPLVVIGLRLAGGPVWPDSLRLALASVAVSLVLWGVSNWRFRLPQRQTPLYPLTILLAVIIAFYSLVSAFTGRTTWKGRTISSGSSLPGEVVDHPGA